VSTWNLHDAGSWHVAANHPVLMDQALDLTGSWPIDGKRMFVRSDQVANLPEPEPAPPPETESRRQRG
jgi:hypothetical protein